MLFSLVERTPYRLRYLCTSQTTTGAPDRGVLVNRFGASPDLRTDAANWRGYALQQLVSTTTINSATARRNMFGDGLTTQLSLEIPRSNVTITPRGDDINEGAKWSVDAARGDVLDPASTNFPVFLVSGPSVGGATAYLEIQFEHTRQR